MGTLNEYLSNTAARTNTWGGAGRGQGRHANDCECERCKAKRVDSAHGSSKKLPPLDFLSRPPVGADSIAKIREMVEGGYERYDKVWISPEVAQWLLETSPGNLKKIRPRALSKYVSDLKAGKFEFVGEPMQLDWNGRLMNGHHRCHAVIESGVGVWVLVVTGLDPALRDQLDLGTTQTLRDQFARHDEKRPKTLIAALHLVSIHNSGSRLYDGGLRASNRAATDLLEELPEIRSSLGVEDHLAAVLMPSVAVFTHYLFGTIDKAKRDEFFAALTSGANLAADNPVFLLRDRLLKERVSRKKISRTDMIALMFRAFNYFRTGHRTKVLRWRFGGTEQFPEP